MSQFTSFVSTGGAPVSIRTEAIRYFRPTVLADEPKPAVFIVHKTGMLYAGETLEAIVAKLRPHIALAGLTQVGTAKSVVHAGQVGLVRAAIASDHDQARAVIRFKKDAEVPPWTELQVMEDQPRAQHLISTARPGAPAGV